MFDIYEKIIEYVDEHIHEEITIDDLLKKIGYSRRYTYTMFQEHNDLPIMEYIRKRKMYAASAELLSERDRNMLDIALDYGYETPAGFYKAFKSVFGCSPTDYKNNMLKGAKGMSNNMRSIEEITKEIELNPNNAELYIERGKSYIQARQTEKAVQDCNKALELDLKRTAEAYRGLAEAYSRSMETDKAIENYTKAIEIEPYVINDYFMRGQTYQNKGEYDKAIEDFTEILEIKPTASAAYMHRGVCWFHLGEPDRTEADFEKAIEAAAPKGLPNTYFSIGMHYADMNRKDKALEYYAKSIELDPTQDWVFGIRAELYRDMGEYEKALEDYGKAIAIRGDVLWLYQSRYRVYKALGQDEKWLADLNKVIELDPNVEWEYIERGIYYEKLGEHEKTDMDFKNIAERYHDNVFILCNLAVHLYQAELFDKATEYFDKVIALDPGELKLNKTAYVRAYLFRGCTYEDTGYGDRALADMNNEQGC